jgi:hypothetical protein
MWKWDQSAGELTRDGKLYGKGYAGNQYGVNNPKADGVQNIGPLPKGCYKMTELRLTGASTGPYTIVLQQVSGDSHGRSAFRIHGDNSKGNRSASHGCIILPPLIRRQIWESGDRELEVVE